MFLNKNSFHFFIVLLFVLSFVVIGETSRRHIEMFLHYQRQREIVHVLETAWTAFKINPDIKLKMNPPFDLKKRRIKTNIGFAEQSGALDRYSAALVPRFAP